MLLRWEFVKLLLVLMPLSALLTSLGGFAMTASEVLKLSQQRVNDLIEIRLEGYSDYPVMVDYKLKISGSSSTQHTGSTTLTPGQHHVLSRMRIPARDGWCAELSVSQDDGVSYETSLGSCE